MNNFKFAAILFIQIARLPSNVTPGCLELSANEIYQRKKFPKWKHQLFP